MCAIAGVSFAPNSKIDRRRLANALLREGEIRGTDASGFAWVMGDEDGVYKRAVAGGKLNTAGIPKNAEAMILHTRAATHGHQRVNENNHPVMSPSGNIRLVHNGIIWNHDEIRHMLGRETALRMPEVDTAALPAVLEVLGIDSTDALEGDAAAAWFDRDTGATLHLARFAYSPVEYAWLEDGSFVFASTEQILGRALDSLGIRWFGTYPGPFESMSNGEYFQLLEGEIVGESTVTWGEDKFSFSTSASKYRSITSGETTRTAPGWSTNRWDEDYDEFWDKPSAFEGSPEVLSTDVPHMQFWIKEADGTVNEYDSAVRLVANLKWLNGLKEGVYDHVDEFGDPELLWVNHVEDIGEINVFTGEYVSWVSKPNEMEEFGAILPSFLRDGVALIRKVSV